MSRAAAAAVAALAAVALGGCGGCGGGAKHQSTASVSPEHALADEATVRLWTRALYDGHYDRAARFFAPGAIVQQYGTRVLRGHAAAVAFNRSLTCRATVHSIRHERNGVLLATFNLGPGARGGCTGGGTVRVRFFIRHGLIETWHQLPDPPARFTQPD
jgi:hypothetical protein